MVKGVVLNLLSHAHRCSCRCSCKPQYIRGVNVSSNMMLFVCSSSIRPAFLPRYPTLPTSSYIQCCTCETGGSRFASGC